MDKEKLYLENERLVNYVFNSLKLFNLNEFDREEWLQEGKLHLWERIDNYDIKKGKFSTFAIKYLRTFYINKIRDSQAQKRTATFVPTNMIINDEDVSLENLYFVDDGFEDELIERISKEQDINMINNVMNNKHSDIVNLLFEGESHVEIAKELGITRQRVGQIVKRIREKYKEVC